MKSLSIQFDYSALLNDALLAEHQSRLEPEVERSAQTAHASYAFCSAPDDHKAIAQVLDLAKQKKALQPTMLLVIGIGGSNLGAMAVLQAVYGQLHNELGAHLRIYFADTVDAEYTRQLLTLVEHELQQGGQVICTVISKSGTTTETVALLSVFLTLLKKYRPETYAQYLVAITDTHSSLAILARQESWSLLTIPPAIGGRYSVLSAVGLFPLALAGIDIDQLVQGARIMTQKCLKKGADNPATKGAAWQFALCKEGYNVSNLFLFSHALAGLGGWWRQLMGESLGKAMKLDGVPNKDGILPIVSIGTTDLHSIGQLFFAHIMPIATTFVTLEKEQSYADQIIDSKLSSLLKLEIKKSSIGDLMKLIVVAVKKAYAKQHMPFRTIVLPERTAYYMGQFLQLCMFEVVYIAYLMGIDPFDQPAVESYKHEIRELLAHE